MHQRIAASALVIALIGCAPDAWRNDAPFDSWLAGVRSACSYAMIGRYQVGSLLGMNASDQATIFLDSTSRLYTGRISPEQWTQQVTSELEGRASDPGVACVLNRLPAR